MATQFNDFLNVQRGTVGGAGGDDTYILSGAMIEADAEITITDSQGENTIQLIDGLEITSSIVASDTVELTLSNGAVVTILGASTFTYEIGGNPVTGEPGTEQPYETFALDTLGVAVPDEGMASGTEVTIGEGGAGTNFTVIQSASTVNEGGSVTYTITADEEVEADTAFSFTLAGSGTSPATAADFSSATGGTATIAAGEKSTTFTVSVAANDGAEFTEGFSVTVTDASGAEVDTLTNSIIDTATNDLTAPTVDAGQNYNYDENQEVGAVIATVKASDNASGVASFAITGGAGGPFAIDDYFTINERGEITLTEAGLTSAANDYEAGDNTFELEVTATDAAGNTSDAATVTLEINDVDDEAPEVKSTVINGTTATITFDEALDETVAVPNPGAFTVTLANGAGEISVLSVTVDGADVTLLLGRAPEAGETFEVAYTPGTNPLQDAAGNTVEAFEDETLLVDTTAPVITAGQAFTYMENTYDDTTDEIGTVEATDNSGSVATFTIDSGNTQVYFAIDNDGKITLTEAGIAAAAASQDFETLPNTFTLGITATDGAGNASTENVTIEITNDETDDSAQPLELTLTSQTDALEGDTGDDTFIGDQTSVQPADVIDGNEGDDVARFTFASGADATYILTSREVETLKLQNANTASEVVFNAINYDNMTTLVNNNSTRTLTVNNLDTNVEIQIVGGDVEVGETDDFKVTYQTGVNTGTANIVLDGAFFDTLDLTNGFTAYNIETTGSSTSTFNDFAVLTDNWNSDIAAPAAGQDGDYDDLAAGTPDTAVVLTTLDTITFTGDQMVTINNELENVGNFIATNSSGGVRVVLDNTTASDITFTGGSGNDRVDVQTTLRITSADKLNGGTGTDTLRMSDDAFFTTANFGQIKGFEILEVRELVNVSAGATYDVDNIVANNVLTGIIIDQNDAEADTIIVQDINDGAKGNISIISTDDTAGDHITLNVKSHASGGTSDSATIILNNDTNDDADGVDVDTLAFANIDILNIQTVESDTVLAQQNSIGDLDAADLETINVSGNDQLSVTLGTSGSVSEVDASDLTDNFTFDVNNSGSNSILVKGGSDNDVIFVDNAGQTGTLYTGGGNDNFEVYATNGGVPLDAETLYLTATGLNSGDVAAGTAIVVDVVNAATVADNVFNLHITDALANLLFNDSINLGTTSAANVDVLNGVLGANTNVVVSLTDVGASTAGVAGIGGLDALNDFRLQIDLNGDGAYNASDDFQIDIVGIVAMTGNGGTVNFDTGTNTFIFNI